MDILQENNSIYVRGAEGQEESISCDSLMCDTPYSADIPILGLCKRDLIEISIVTEGYGFHRVFDSVIPCKEGDVYVILPNVPHAYFAPEEGGSLTVRRIRFCLEEWFTDEVAQPDSVRFCYGVFGDNAHIAYAMLSSETRNDVYTICSLIENEIQDKSHEWRECVRSHLSVLLITIGRYVNKAIKNISPMPHKEWGIVCSAIQYVSEHIGDTSLTLEAIASGLYISKSQLSRIFRRTTGKPFSEYIKDTRLERACSLLSETTLTIEEIVARCGLRDVPSFYRSFHAYANMTPSQYRGLHNKNKNANKNSKGDKIMIILSEISEKLQAGRAKVVKELVQQAIDEGCDTERILNEGLLHGMNVIGEKFKNNEVYVPEVLVAARAMNMGMQILKPHLMANGVKANGKVCIGTVQGDLHDIGKNLVRMMLEGKGLDVVDLGVDVPADKFVQAAIDNGCQVICCSALLTTTMNVMAEVVKAAEAAGIRDKVRIMVGGAPVNQDFCNSIGADCYTTDAASAADAAVALCKEVANA